MAGTKEGGLKVREKNLAKDPNYYVKIGAKGGLKETPLKGFGSPLVDKNGLTGAQRASVYGAEGGRRSRPHKTSA